MRGGQVVFQRKPRRDPLAVTVSVAALECVMVTGAHPSDVPSGTAQFTVDGATYGARVELIGGKGAASVSGLAGGRAVLG
ncbi:hypothetical protein V6U89_20230 [Micromonospora sp. CPCC 206171]|uniref:hypothetical protein n=1 Tax=Micromonospora sp. CPCC 206171 TaxID=3122405 RepID=UPI002FF115E1